MRISTLTPPCHPEYQRSANEQLAFPSAADRWFDYDKFSNSPHHVILSEVEGSYAARMAPAGCVRFFDFAQNDMIEQPDKKQ